MGESAAVLADTESLELLERWMSKELIRLREQAGLSQEQAAERLACSRAHISHLETGRNFATQAEVEVLFAYYKCPELVQRFLRALRLVKNLEPLDVASDNDPDSFRTFGGLEAGAAVKHGVNLLALDGLVQADAYMHMLLTAFDPAAAPEVIEHRMRKRRRRQEAITRSRHPLELHLIIPDELVDDALPDEVMVPQLELLYELTGLANVHAVIAPRGCALVRAQHHPWARLEFEIPGDDGLVYLDTSPKGITYKKKAEIEIYKERAAALRDASWDEDQSRRRIHEVLTLRKGNT